MKFEQVLDTILSDMPVRIVYQNGTMHELNPTIDPDDGLFYMDEQGNYVDGNWMLEWEVPVIHIKDDAVEVHVNATQWIEAGYPSKKEYIGVWGG